MFGDELQHAVSIINKYLSRDAIVYLWDENNPDTNEIRLDKNSKLEFSVFEIGLVEE